MLQNPSLLVALLVSGAGDGADATEADDAALAAGLIDTLVSLVCSRCTPVPSIQ